MPREIGFQIWINCLPPSLNVHFFDIINHAPAARHHEYHWSNKELHVRASKDHESGYLHVLPMMEACREARNVIILHYSALTRKYHDSESGFDPGDVALSNHANNSDTSTHLPQSFIPFDWIPPQDLIMLCLSPRPASRFPSTHDIMLPGRPYIGFAIPTQFFDGESPWIHSGLTQEAPRLQQPVQLLHDLLAGSKPPKSTYLLSIVQAFKKQKISSHLHPWIQRGVYWAVHPWTSCKLDNHILNNQNRKCGSNETAQVLVGWR